MMIASRDQGAIDDPRPAAIAIHLGGAGGETRRHHSNNSMDGRPRYREHRGEFAKGKVGAKGNAGDQSALPDRLRPWTTAARLGLEPRDQLPEAITVEASESEQTLDSNHHGIVNVRSPA